MYVFILNFINCIFLHIASVIYIYFFKNYFVTNLFIFFYELRILLLTFTCYNFTNIGNGRDFI